MKRIVATLATLVLAVTALTACSSGPSPEEMASARAELQSYADASADDDGRRFADAGYTKATTEVYFRYLHGGDALHEGDADYSGCGYSTGHCSVMKVAAVHGCSSLFMSVNFEDASGNVVDSGIDSANSLGEGATAILHFTTFSDSAETIRVTEAKCY